jgi:group I intron endonuclease
MVESCAIGLNISVSNNNIYPKQAGVYKLTCKINNKIYIGKGVNLRNRMREYSNYGKNHKGRHYIQHAVIKHGWDNFSVEILEIMEGFDKSKDNDKLLLRESYYIELFDSTNPKIGYNLCKFSNDRTGSKCSEETREKMRKAQKGKTITPENLGKPI